MTLEKLISRSTKELEQAGSLTAELDVRLILEDVIRKDSSYFFAHPEAMISNPAYQKFRRLIRRRKTGEPVAYILGWKEFYGLRFKVNKNVLIPRPETEAIVDETIAYLKTQISNLKNRSLNILDVGTGSGAIIIALAKTLKYDNIRYYASDISKKALRVAKENAKLNGVSTDIKFFQSDLLDNPTIPRKIDILIANLPYIPFSVHNDKTLSFEPETALFAKKSGLELIEKLIIQASKLNPRPQLIILEVFETHPKFVKELNNKYLPMYSLEVKKDYANLNRFIILSILP